VRISQDAAVYAGLFNGREQAIHHVASGRRVYVHVARGTVTVAGTALKAGDALKAVDPGQILIEDGKDAEILLFDLA
jgi:redox-sensitive bicupin YhaK (pirin superfamily)